MPIISKTDVEGAVPVTIKQSSLGADIEWFFLSLFPSYCPPQFFTFGLVQGLWASTVWQLPKTDFFLWDSYGWISGSLVLGLRWTIGLVI